MISGLPYGSGCTGGTFVEFEEPDPYMNLTATVGEPRGAQDVSMSKMQQLVSSHADLLFPNRTPSSAFMKLFEELGEVIKEPTDAKEWADVFILMLDLAKMHGVIDLAGAILAKMADNQMREWRETPTGTFQHIPGPPLLTDLPAEPFKCPDRSPAGALCLECDSHCKLEHQSRVLFKDGFPC